MFDLIRMSISGFRGFVEDKEFVFDSPVTLLFGENHRGKSSTLNAIEWCLFGSDCVGKKTGIRERLDWEICNRFMPKKGVIVSIEFKSPDGVYIVERRQQRADKRGAGSLVITLPDTTKVDGDEAEQMLYTMFHSSFHDFMTSVYQHQEAIRDVLIREPRDRNDAIDRLLGLSQYRELVKGITDAKIRDVQKGMDIEWEQFRSKSEQAIRTLDTLVKGEREKAISDGITEPEITERGALTYAKSIVRAVRELASELGVADVRIDEPAKLHQIGRFRESVKQQTDDLWAKAPDVLKSQKLATEQQELGTIKGRYDAAREAYSKAQQELETFVKKNGDEATINAAIMEKNDLIENLKDRIRQTNERANLVREAIQYLRNVDVKSKKVVCPLCGSATPDLLAHLENEWKEKIKGEVKDLEAKRKEYESASKALDISLEQLKQHETAVQSAGRKCEEHLKIIAEAFGRKIGDKEDPIALLDKRLGEIKAELELVQMAIVNKRGKISAIYDLLTKLRKIDDILEYEGKKAAIDRIWESDECKDLGKLRDQASALVEDVGSIRSAIGKASREEAEDRIGAAGKALDNYFTCIAKHPAIPGLTMEVFEDRRAGLNSYAFKCKDGSDPTPILSQGDLNCFALSLFFGLAEASSDTRQFSFLMLDDPTQSLGPEMKRELVNIIGDLAERRKLVIATPDLEFQNSLITNVTKSKTVYDFLEWDVNNGPNVKRRK